MCVAQRSVGRRRICVLVREELPRCPKEKAQQVRDTNRQNESEGVQGPSAHSNTGADLEVVTKKLIPARGVVTL